MITNLNDHSIQPSQRKTIPRKDDLLFLSSRFQRVLVRYADELPALDRFMCAELADRAAFIVRLGHLGGAIPPAMVQQLRAQMDGRLVAAGTCEAGRIPLAIFQISYVPQTGKLKVIPAFTGRQMVVYGPTGTGKTTLLQQVLSQRQGIVVIIDPHYAAGKGKWHSGWIIIGAGRRFDEIDATLKILVAVMEHRYQQAAQGLDQFTPLHIAVDELSAFASNIPDGAKNLISLIQEGRKIGIFVILTPHSPEVRQMGFEGRGGARDNLVFVRMPVIRPGEETKQRVVTVYYGNPMTTEPDGQYIVPPPAVYQGEPRLMSAAELATKLGVSQDDRPVSETVSRVVSSPVSQIGHQPDTTGQPVLAFKQRYAKGKDAALELATYLVLHGYGIKKISELLPYRADDARATAAEAMSATIQGQRSARNSQDEARMVWELYKDWGVPVNRLARLLDGADHENVSRVQSIVFERTR